MDLKEGDIESFLKDHPFFCLYCGEFTIINKDVCEVCGTKNSLRKTTVENYKEYSNLQEKFFKERLKAKKDRINHLLKASQLKTEELKSIPTINPYKGRPSSEIINLCHSCGHKILDLKNQFCVNCGAQLKKVLPEIEQEEIVKPVITIKKEREPKIVIMPQEQEIPPSSKIEQPKSYEEPVIKAPQVKTEDIRTIPTIQEKKEEKLKETHIICRFCGMKLELTEKFCYQCGTIIK
ncbi:MAG: hypothetical protein ACFE9Q_07640 [Candidatus Hodarchaeota archaeon]